MTRKERVKKVYDLINELGNNERNFSELYSKLLEEFSLEEGFNPNMRENHYLNNLRQTRDKQAETYIYSKQKRPVKGAPSEFKEFVSHFRHDTTWAAV
jgi:hypothetical protein